MLRQCQWGGGADGDGDGNEDDDGALVRMVQLVGASSHTPKGFGFYSQPRHKPSLQVHFPVRAHTEDN